MMLSGLFDSLFIFDQTNTKYDGEWIVYAYSFLIQKTLLQKRIYVDYCTAALVVISHHHN